MAKNAIDLINTKPSLGKWGRPGAISEVKLEPEKKNPSWASPPAPPKEK